MTKRNAGGIIGYLNDAHIDLSINYCTNTASIYAGGGYVADTSDISNKIVKSTIETVVFQPLTALGVVFATNPFVGISIFVVNMLT